MGDSQSRKNVVFPWTSLTLWVGGGLGAPPGPPLISEMEEPDDAVGMLSFSPKNTFGCARL